MNERLKEVIDYLIKEKRVYNQKDFCEKLGRNDSVISGIVNGKRKLTMPLVYDISTKFTEINPEFLYNPDCKRMLTSGDNSVTGDFSKNVSSSIHVSQSEELAAIVRKQQEQIDRLLSIIEKLTK